ncbi:unnamed protein product [Trifolium pratense]|uniref:Uncharacterized protein n=1 Tax=Trifolium pratense TaxID=57577 RepID=A0ACB0INM3_TRIPR|nr:unnamed protein product [Trifolium pratense]
MNVQFIKVVKFRFFLKCNKIDPLSKRFSSSFSNGSSFSSSETDWNGKVKPFMDDGCQENAAKIDGMRKTVYDVCGVLENGSWGPAIEDALNSFDEMSQPEVIVGVMKRLKDVNVAFQYFRWVEGKTEQGNCAEVYNSFLMVMARTRNLEYLEQILEEMSVAGFGISNHVCIELVTSFVRSHKLKEAFGVNETMRKFNFRPAFSAYTTLIGALSEANIPDPMLTLFHQMQEIVTVRQVKMCKTRKLTKLRRKISVGEIIVRKVECLKMRKIEKGTVRMNITLKAFTAKVEETYHITRDGVMVSQVTPCHKQQSVPFFRVAVFRRRSSNQWDTSTVVCNCGSISISKRESGALLSVLIKD